MIYFFGGKDASEKAKKLVDSLLEKKPETSIFYFDDENYKEGEWIQSKAAQGLFSEQHIVYSRNLSLVNDAVTNIKKDIKDLVLSKNIFIFSETKTNKFSNLLQKHANKSVYKEIEVVKKELPNLFDITDAFGLRDRKKMWLLVNRNLFRGVGAEEIHSILRWQIKTMLLIKALSKKDAEAAAKLGIKPFTFRKAISFDKNYSTLELKNISRKLILMFQDSRSGSKELSVSLEKLILSI